MHDLREQTLHSSPFKYGFYALLCLGGATTGVWMCILGEWLGYVCASFFGLGLIVLVIQMMPGASYLRLTAEGFELASLFRRHFVRWDRIEEMGVWTMRRGLAKSKMVCFNYLATAVSTSRARELSRRLTGFEGGLPDTYGLSAEELLSLMTPYWRAARDGECKDVDADLQTG